MVEIREEQLGPIRLLARDGYGEVSANNASIVNSPYMIITGQSSSPTTGVDKGSFWVGNGSPTLPKFTDSAGTTVDLASTLSLPVIASTSRDLALTDGGKTLFCTNNITLTIPNSSSVNPPIGTVIWIISGPGDTNATTLEVSGGVTLIFPELYTPVIVAFGMARLWKAGGNTWYLSGDLIEA